MISWISIILFILASLVLYALYQLVLKPYRGLLWYKKQGIPIYYFFPALGLAKLYGDNFKNHKDSMHFLKVMNYDEEKKKIYSLNMSTSVIVHIVDTNLMKECLLSPDLLEKDPFFIRSLKRFLGNNNLVFNEGKEWKKSRKVITNSFTFNFLTDNLPNFISSIDRRLENLNDGSNNVNLKNFMEELVAEVLLSVLFDKELGDKRYKGMALSHWVTHIINSLGEQTLSPLNFLFGEQFFKLGLRSSDRKLNENMKNIKQIFNDHVKEKRNQKNPFNENTLLANLLKNEEFLKEKAEVESDTIQRITNELMTMFFAGTDSTSTLLVMVFYGLGTHADCLNKLFEEIDRSIKNENSITYDSLNSLDYLTAVIKETLRIYGPSTQLIPRIAANTFRLGDYIIKKDTIINLPFITNFFDKQYFKDPFNFRPERWLDPEEMKIHQQDPYIYIPFSAGPRNCPGQHLAMLETKIIIVKILLKYRLEIKNKNIEMLLKLSYFYKDPFFVDFKLRNSLRK